MLESRSTPPKKLICRFLLVEDIAYVRSINKGLIKAIMPDCEIDEATNESEAITCGLQQEYGLILMDIGLPGGDGKAACLEILNNPTSKNSLTPIVALTGHADNEAEVRACLKAGMKDVFKKPLTIEVAKQILRKYFFMEDR